MLHLRGKSKSVKKLINEFRWVLLGQVVTVMGSIWQVRAISEYLKPLEYGKLALALTFSTLVNQVVMGGLTAGIGRLYPVAKERDQLNEYIQSVKFVLSIATIIVGGFCGIILAWINASGATGWYRLIFATAIYSIFSGLNNALNSIQSAARQRASVALHTGIDSWLKILFVYVFVNYFGPESSVAMVGFAGSSFLVGLSQIIQLKKLNSEKGVGREKSSRKAWGTEIWQFAWPFSIWGVFTWAHQASDKWGLEKCGSTFEVGQY
jgi:O-antigen/teichoic acid export membrane protein